MKITLLKKTCLKKKNICLNVMSTPQQIIIQLVDGRLSEGDKHCSRSTVNHRNYSSDVFISIFLKYHVRCTYSIISTQNIMFSSGKSGFFCFFFSLFYIRSHPKPTPYGQTRVLH